MTAGSSVSAVAAWIAWIRASMRVGASDMVFAEEAFQGVAPGAFDLLEGGPSGDEGTEDEGLLVAEPLYGLRIIGFEGADQAVCRSDADHRQAAGVSPPGAPGYRISVLCGRRGLKRSR